MHTYNDIEAAEPRTRRQLWYAILLAAIAHVVILFNLSIERPSLQREQTINVRLFEPRLEPTPAQPSMIDTPTSVNDAPTNFQQDTIEPAPEPLKNQEVRGLELFQNTIDAIRRGEHELETGSLGNVSNHWRSQLPSRMIKPAVTVRSQGRLGHELIMKRDEFGNVTCVQERGDWSDWGEKWQTLDKQKNPNLYYWVPSAMCGHLID